MGFLGEFGEIIRFAVVTIFQRFFSLCILYGTIIRPEHIYFVYHIYPVMDHDKDFAEPFFAQEKRTPVDSVQMRIMKYRCSL